MAKILIIEDSELVQKTYKRLLRDHELTIVDTGLAAMQLLESETFDVIISDGDLEGPLGGADVWAWVQNNRRDLIPKFMFCSGNGAIEKLSERWGIPYNDKTDPRAILTIVNNILEVQS